MKKFGVVILLVILAALALFSAFRIVKFLFFGGLSSYNVGRITGSVFVAILCSWGAMRVLAKLRSL